MMRRWKYRSRSVSFGLTPEHEEYIFDECFHCVYYGHLGFSEAYNLPIKWRKWWLRKINEVHEEENKRNQQGAVMPQQVRRAAVRAREVGR